MATDEASLWRTIGMSLADAFRQAPGFESRLTPTGWLLITGEPFADFNWLLVDAGPDPAGQLREFAGVLAAGDLPGLVLLTTAVVDRLAPVAADLGLKSAGTVHSCVTGQPQSTMSSSWKWIAAYSSGACRQHISRPDQVEPVTARVGMLRSVP